MPLPVALGLPWLIGIVGGLFAAVLEFFGKYLSRRLALVVAALATITALTAAFYVAIGGLISALTVAAPSFVMNGLGHIWPSNMQACIAAIAAGHVLRFAYEWNIRAARMKAL